MKTITLASYRHQGDNHTVELIANCDSEGGLRLVDRAPEAPTRLVAELGADEGIKQARAVLYGDGGYLERAAAGEAHLAAVIDDEPAAPQGEREQAA